MKILLLVLLMGAAYGEERFALPKGVTLVYFESDNCAPCIRLKKQLDDLGIGGSIVFYNIKNPGVREYMSENKVIWTPTVIVMKDGKEINRFDSGKTDEVLIHLLELRKK